MGLRFVSALLLLLLGVSVTRAGAPANPLSSPEVIVGTVKAVPAEEATNGNPARVTVEINETLRGQLKGEILVVWSGPSHSVDWGEPDKNPAVIKWAAEKAEKPKVGEAYILFGSLFTPKQGQTEESQRLYTSPGGRMPRTDANLEKARRIVKDIKEEVKAEQARQAAQAAQHAAEVKQWRAGMTEQKLATALKEADFVGVGKVVSQLDNRFQFVVTETFKGEKRKSYTNGAYYVELPVTKEVAALLDRDSEYVLLLSEKGLIIDPSVVVYQPVGDGVVLADPASLKAARELTKR